MSLWVNIKIPWSHNGGENYLWKLHLMPHWGIFSFRVTFTDLNGVTWSFPLTKYALRRRFVHYCYDDSSMEPLGSHPAKHALLGTHMPSYSSIREMHLRLMSMILLWIQVTKFTYLLMDDLISFDFSRLVTHLMPHWGIFPLSIEICRSPLIRVIVPSYEIRVKLTISISFFHDSSVDLPLSRFIRLTLSDVSMIFGWSCLRLMDSHIIISLECMSNLSCIPIELLMSYQDRLGTSDAILGHISLIQLWRWSFSHRSVAVFIIRPRDVVFASWVTIPVIFIEMSFH